MAASCAEKESEEKHDGEVQEGEERKVVPAEAPSREPGVPDKEFYLRYYVGHRGRFGHEFLEIEFCPDGTFRYANNSSYRNDSMIKKDGQKHELKACYAGSTDEFYDDEKWPEPNEVGRQELEIITSTDHVSFVCAKIGSMVDVKGSEDPEGMEALYYLVQDLRCLAFSLIAAHFKIKPIPQ